MNKLPALLERTWVDWVVCLCMAVTAASCKSPFLVASFAVVALAAAVCGVRKTWQMARPDRSRSAL
ncbi:hypothetical protein ACFQ77_14235 [Streptomyces virginiae]|uniref:hypothetical protein n=1 Tax=Streptomyces virginiae TaxID=1961 RepID=UPI0036CE40D8